MTNSRNWHTRLIQIPIPVEKRQPLGSHFQMVHVEISRKTGRIGKIWERVSTEIDLDGHTPEHACAAIQAAAAGVTDARVEGEYDYAPYDHERSYTLRLTGKRAFGPEKEREIRTAVETVLATEKSNRDASDRAELERLRTRRPDLFT